MLQKIAAAFATLIRTWNIRMKYFLMNFMGLPLLQCQILREFFFPYLFHVFCQIRQTNVIDDVSSSN